MDKLFVSKNFFNIQDTLTCGQIFSYKQLQDKFLVRSQDKFAYLYYYKDNVVIESSDILYFYNFFNLETDYSLCVQKAKEYNIPILTNASEVAKGIRILKQDATEVLFSFLISQNNNIKRITNSIEYICQNLGEYNKEFCSFSFPSINKLASVDVDFYKKAGLGYRAEYFLELAKNIQLGNIDILKLQSLQSKELKEQLLKIKGVGEKVASCVMLFGFNRQNMFPVDTWIEKIYLQDFALKPTSREKISEYFMQAFGDYSGIIQQYLFHYKRNILN